MNELNVYWTVLPNEPMGKNQTDPRKVTAREWEGEGFTFCPAFNLNLQNVFSIDSRIDMDWVVNKETKEIHNHPNYDSFFDKFKPKMYPFMAKDKKRRRCTYAFQLPISLVADTNDLEMSVMHPFMSHTDWSNKVDLIPGQFNIGKYARAMGIAFQQRDEENQFIKIRQGDPLYYIKFHTNKKIKFTPFFADNDIQLLLKEATSGRNIKSLKKYYDNYKRFNIKKLLLKKIKAQLK